jgi:hypothetical protein
MIVSSCIPSPDRRRARVCTERAGRTQEPTPALGDDASLPLLLCPPGIVIPLSSLREHPLHEAAITTMRRIFVNVLTMRNGLHAVRDALQRQPVAAAATRQGGRDQSELSRQLFNACVHVSRLPVACRYAGRPKSGTSIALSQYCHPDRICKPFQCLLRARNAGVFIVPNPAVQQYRES